MLIIDAAIGITSIYGCAVLVAQAVQWNDRKKYKERHTRKYYLKPNYMVADKHLAAVRRALEQDQQAPMPIDYELPEAEPIEAPPHSSYLPWWFNRILQS